MADETTLTPGEIAQNEAAKQAVIFVFGVASIFVMMIAQKRIAAAMRDAMSPDAAREQRMSDAQRIERAWVGLAATAWRVSAWAARQAESARLRYDKERAT